MAVSSQEIEHLRRTSYMDLTTTGRKTGKPRTVELSFALKGSEIVCLAGKGGSVDWYRNMIAEPRVSIRAGRLKLRGRTVKRISHSGKLVREILRLFREKYGAGYVRDWYQGTNRAPVRIRILGRL